MAGEEPRKRDEEKKARIVEHSDVYLVNDKLTEKLEFSLDSLSSRCHRQLANRDEQIRELRQRLGSMSVSTTVSSVTSLRPHTTPSPTLRRLKAPPVIVKLNVRVPTNDSSSKDSDADNDSDGEGDDDDSSDDGARNRMRQQQRRMKVAWAESEEEMLDKFAAKQDAKKVTKEQVLIGRLNMDAIPSNWFTEVYHPSDIPVKRRIASASPSTRTKPSAAASTAPRRPKSETALLRLRRAKSALPASSSPFSSSSSIAALDEEERLEGGGASTVFCGGKQQRPETMRSRRQLMELAGPGRHSGVTTGAQAARLRFLEAVRLERVRLDARVKLFLQSCDRVGVGGISSRRAREYQKIILPHTMYG